MKTVVMKGAKGTRKTVAILGGGFAGALAAKKLEKDFEVTLIDQKDYFEFTPAVLRTLVEPCHIGKIQVRHRDYLQQTQVIVGQGRDISEHRLTVNGKKHHFDYLVIATGSSYRSKIKQKNLVIASRAEELQKYAEQLASTKKVLIIGGGIVGVELAAEIIGKYPTKEITIAHATGELIDRSPLKARQYALTFLQRKGVKIVFHEMVEERKGKFLSNKGTAFPCDLAFLCVGIMPNAENLGICSEDLNKQKQLCVNQYLQVDSFQHIFAAGDITDVKEEKTAQASEKQAEVVVKNIMALEQGKELENYSVKQKPMVISLGKWDGMFIYKNFVATGIIPAFLKWFVEKKTMWRYR